MKPTTEQAHRRLHEQLAQLHEELSSATSVAPADMELLRKLGEDIKVLSTAEPAARSSSYESMGKRTREAIQKFQATHPELSRRMERLIDQLALLNL